MNYKKITWYVLVVILGVLLFNLLTANNIKMQYAANRIEVEEVVKLHFPRVIYGLLLGLLVKWQIIIQCFKGNIHLNFKLIVGTIIFLTSLIPPVVAMQFLSLASPFPQGPIGMNMIKAPFLDGTNQLVLSVMAGVLIAEGFHEKDKEGKFQ